MIKEEQRPKLAACFGWWWRDISKAMLPVYLASPHCAQTKSFNKIPKGEKGPFTMFNMNPEWGTSVDKLPREHQEALCLMWYVEYCSEHAFRYELHARRGFTSNDSNAAVDYEHGKPFHKLTNEQIQMLVILHNTRLKNQPLAVTAKGRKKKTFAYTVSALEDVANPQIVEHMAEQARHGWTEPRLINFNLRQCADNEILDRLGSFIRCERMRLGIPSSAWEHGKEKRREQDRNTFHANRSARRVDTFATRGSQKDRIRREAGTNRAKSYRRASERNITHCLLVLWRGGGRHGYWFAYAKEAKQRSRCFYRRACKCRTGESDTRPGISRRGWAAKPLRNQTLARLRAPSGRRDSWRELAAAGTDSREAAFRCR